MNTRTISYVAISTLLVIASLFTITVPVSAANVSWDGEGADDNFSTAANWAGDTVPVDGDVLIFDSLALAGDVVYNNDLTGLDVAGISVTGINPNDHRISITGNPLTISGNITLDQNNTLYLILSLVLNTNSVITVPSGANLDIGDYTSAGLYDLDIQGNTLTFAGSTSCGIFVSSSLKGSGVVNVGETTSGVVLRAPSDTFTGSINVNDGTLGVNVENAINGASLVTVNSGGVLGFGLSNENRSYSTPVTFNGGGLSVARYNIGFCAGLAGDNDYAATLSGTVTLMADTVFTGDGNATISGAYTPNSHTFTIASGNQGIVTTPQGVITAPAQTTTVNSGDSQPSTVVIINTNQTTVINGERGDVIVYSRGVLKGTGVVDNLYLRGGTIAPGLSPGILNTSNLDLTEGGTLEIELGGTTPGNATTNHDQLNVTGTVDLGSATTLETTHWNGFRPALNNQFVIISNDSTDAVNGTFQGLADGATFTVDGITYTISYDGGDGNDVVLTATNVPTAATAPDTGFAQLANPLVVTILSIVSVLSITVVYKKFAK